MHNALHTILYQPYVFELLFCIALHCVRLWEPSICIWVLPVFGELGGDLCNEVTTTLPRAQPTRWWWWGWGRCCQWQAWWSRALCWCRWCCCSAQSPVIDIMSAQYQASQRGAATDWNIIVASNSYLLICTALWDSIHFKICNFSKSSLSKAVQ